MESISNLPALCKWARVVQVVYILINIKIL